MKYRQGEDEGSGKQEKTLAVMGRHHTSTIQHQYTSTKPGRLALQQCTFDFSPLALLSISSGGVASPVQTTFDRHTV